MEFSVIGRCVGRSGALRLVPAPPSLRLSYPHEGSASLNVGIPSTLSAQTELWHLGPAGRAASVLKFEVGEEKTTADVMEGKHTWIPQVWKLRRCFALSRMVKTNHWCFFLLLEEQLTAVRP